MRVNPTPCDPKDETLRQFLKTVSLFDQFDERELALFISLMSRREYEANEMVFDESSQEKAFFIVESGKLTLKIWGEMEKDFKEGATFGEIAIIDNGTRTGKVTTLEPSVLLCVTGAALFDETQIDTKTAFKIFQALACKVISYLRSRIRTSTKALIEGGESEYVEFKCRMRILKPRNQKEEEADARAKFEVAQAIVAFLNSKDGGTLLVGVEDNKMIRGIAGDFPMKPQQDQDIHHCLVQVLSQRIPESSYNDFINPRVEHIVDEKDHFKEKTVLRVDCRHADVPIWLEDEENKTGKVDKYKFFIRSGPRSISIPPREVREWIVAHFSRK